ncbi:MAG: glycosyltransferase family 2 protein, partial [Thermomicrobium sp.]|nr:glycosyltransferase family 2 protein [Thermomicrobium sp.]
RDSRYFGRWHGPLFVRRLSRLAELAAAWTAIRARLARRPDLAERARLWREVAAIYRNAAACHEPT